MVLFIFHCCIIYPSFGKLKNGLKKTKNQRKTKTEKWQKLTFLDFMQKL